MNQSSSNPYNALKLAKSGNPKAIQTVINYLLKEKEVTTKVLLKNDAVHIILEFEKSIDPSISALSIIKILNKINAPYLNAAVIQAKVKGQVNPIWTECIQLNVEAKAEAEITSTEPKKISSFSHWPAWFPYPSSWLRSMILLLWVGIVVSKFWDFFSRDLISSLPDDPILLLIAIGLILLASCLPLSYVYHLIDFKKSSRWFPRPIKLWEGIYAPIVLIISVFCVVMIALPFSSGSPCASLIFPDPYYCSNTINDYIIKLADFETRIWLLCAAYLYQIEYLLRTHFPFKKFLKYTAIGLMSVFILVNIQLTIKNWNYIYGAIAALTTTTTEEINPVNSTVTQTQPADKSTKTPKIDPFQAAINQATIAAELTQSAQSPLEWQQVANHWESALNLMKVVPPSHSQYIVAQDRVIQYQKNLDYANTNQTQNYP